MSTNGSGANNGQGIASGGGDNIISVHDLVVSLNDRTILTKLTLDVKRGEVLGFVGGSGQGKTVLMRTIIGLLPKVSGTIEVFGVDLDQASETQRHAVERRWGVLFQQGAVDSVTGDDTVLAGFVAQDPYAKVVGSALTSEPYGLGVAKTHPEFVRFVNGVLADIRANGTWAAMYRTWLAPDGGAVPAPPVAVYGRAQ